MSKQYGLILKKKEDRSRSSYEANRISREAKVVIDKALEEDPDIFAYDEIYDEMKSSQNASYSKATNSNDIKKGSKFIGKLKLNAEKRKVAEERRIDRQIEREREAEGDQFADKEIFVTDAYKQKLMERKVYEERERKEIELEDMMDVRKQEHGISAFYRNFLSQQVGEKVELKPKEKYLDKMTEDLRKQLLDKDDKLDEKESTEFKKSTTKSLQSKRQRKSSSSSEEEGVVIRDLRKNKERKKKNEKSEENDDLKINDKKEDEIELDQKLEKQLIEQKELDKNKNELDKDDENDKKAEKKVVKVDKENDDKLNEPEPIRLTLREILTELFKKKCVDEEFLEQQKRYFERKENY